MEAKIWVDTAAYRCQEQAVQPGQLEWTMALLSTVHSMPIQPAAGPVLSTVEQGLGLGPHPSPQNGKTA